MTINDLSNACFYDNCGVCRDPNCMCECHIDDNDDDWDDE